MESNLKLPIKNTPKLNVKTVSSALFGKDGSSSESIKNIHGTLSKLTGFVRNSLIRVKALEFNVDNITSKVDKLENITELTPKSEFKETGKLKNAKGLENTLVETNKILVEIQKQLSLESQMRSIEQKNKEDLFKRSKSRKKLKAEESLLEKSAKKLGKGVKKTVDKIVSPVKNIFDQILGFLVSVGAGIAANAAFEWLKDPENRKQLDEWFGWVAKNWKWIAGITAGVLLLQPVLSIVGAIGGAILTIKAGLDLFNLIRLRLFGGGKITPGGSGKPSGGRRSSDGRRSSGSGKPSGGSSNTGLNYARNVDPKSGAKLRSPGSISRYNASMARSLQGRANIGDNARLAIRNLKPGSISKAVKFGGPAIAVGAAGLDYKSRKDAGQTDVQAAAGSGGGLLASITAGALAATVIPEPTSTVGGLAVLGLIYGISTLGSVFGSAAADKITGVEPRERGGPITAGKPYLVGEGGPELVVPKLSGTVINNMKTEKIYQMISSDMNGNNINLIELPEITNQMPLPEIDPPRGPASEVPEISSTNLADPYRQLSPMLYGITV